MIGNLSFRKRTKACRPSAATLSTDQGRRETWGSFPPTQSQQDFLQALQLLGGKPRLGRYRSGDWGRRALPVCVSCSYRAWLSLFGEPQEVETNGSSSRVVVHTWRHCCTDGPVTCIGRLFERSSGVQWVVLVRVCLN